MSYTDAYTAAMERLIDVVQQLSQAHDHETICNVVRAAARNLTGADGATLVLRDGDQCYYVAENAIEPLWKGRRFPIHSCISGWVMTHRDPVAIQDIYSDDRVPHDAYRPTFVKSLVMVPIRREAPIGAIGNYWASSHAATDEEIGLLQALADTTSVALENAQLYADLRQQLQTLKAQEARILAQRGSLEVFARALAHDLKEPVRTIRSFIDLMDAERGGPHEQEYRDYIAAAAERMMMLIDSVFRYTQLDDPLHFARKPCSMGDTLSAAVQDLALLLQDSRATVSYGSMPVVQGDKVQMGQVWQNLISNAIRHSDHPVRIDINVEPLPAEWKFSVADDGPGIAPEFLDAIFQPFKRLTRRNHCSGLGLAACRKIIEAHGGRLWCESEPGHGATFFFTLPRDANAPQA